jgi:hypothetical protein
MHEWLKNPHSTNRAPHKPPREHQSSEPPPGTRARPEDESTTRARPHAKARCGHKPSRASTTPTQHQRSEEEREEREQRTEHGTTEKTRCASTKQSSSEHPPSQAHPYHHIHAKFKVSCAMCLYVNFVYIYVHTHTHTHTHTHRVVSERIDSLARRCRTSEQPTHKPATLPNTKNIGYGEWVLPPPLLLSSCPLSYAYHLLPPLPKPASPNRDTNIRA